MRYKYNEQLTKQYMQFIEQAGYKDYNDNLGYYFDNGIKKFSVMKSGPVFNFFYNKKVDGAWILQLRKMGMLNFEECLRLILDCIQKEV